MEYNIKKVKWHVYITVNIDMTCMWIAAPPPKKDGIIINLAGTSYFDKENPQNGVNLAEEGWKEYAEANGIVDYEIERVGDKKENEGEKIEDAEVVQEKKEDTV